MPADRLYETPVIKVSKIFLNVKDGINVFKIDLGKIGMNQKDVFKFEFFDWLLPEQSLDGREKCVPIY